MVRLSTVTRARTLLRLGTAVLVGWLAGSPATFGEPIGDATANDRDEVSVARFVARDGTLTLELDHSVLNSIGWSVIASRKAQKDETTGRSVFSIADSSTLLVETQDGSYRALAGGSVQTFGALLIDANGSRIPLANLELVVSDDGAWSVQHSLDREGAPPVFTVGSRFVDFTPATGRLRLFGELLMHEAWAREHGLSLPADTVFGTILIEARTRMLDGQLSEDAVVGSESVPVRGAIGPDVIVGDLHEANSYGSSGEISAFSIGTTSCNIGDEPLNWFANTSAHPVIAQNMYRLKDGRFEQIGQSWLKHGFFAVSGSLCSGPGGCDGDPTGEHLGVGCSDPYSANLNGQRSNLGPRSEVNPYTGVFPFPFSAPPSDALIGRRLQVANTDLDPTLNEGASYFVEGQYVAADDAAAGNGDNNASHRPIIVGGGGSSFSITLVESTRRQSPALEAWQAIDPEVLLSPIDILNDGMMLLGARVTDTGEGIWHYEYALQNINSNRAAGSFTIHHHPAATPTHMGFHDIDSHSGEPYSIEDWAVVADGTEITWSTERAEDNPNANALRWGTLYNFWFDLDVPPAPVPVTVGLFKTGIPSSLDVESIGPSLSAPDCDGDGIANACEIDCGPAGGACDVAGCGLVTDCGSNGIPDDCESDDDGDGFVNSCDICPGSPDGTDSDGDTIPDGCDACDGFDDSIDPDGDGIPDGCDNCPTVINPSQLDSDGNGIGNACDPAYCVPVPLNDHFDVDPGWTAFNVTATAGLWEWGMPVGGGDRLDPPDDFDGGGGCYLTENVDGNSDVDGGTTRLVSPVFEITPGDATLTYAYWFATSEVEGADSLDVELSLDNGQTWALLASYTVSNQTWLTESVALGTSPVQERLAQLRFSATDGGAFSLVEAGVDAVELTVDCDFDCSGDPSLCDDLNPCTDDSCEGGQCVHINNASSCDDGDACTVSDFCNEGACIGGGPLPCTGIDCTDCNANGLRDDCEGLPDCNANGIPDGCEFADCNNNGTNDVCEIALDPGLDCAGGPVGQVATGNAIFSASCAGCHGIDGTGGFGPNIREHDRITIRNKLRPPTTHTGGAFLEFTAQDFADLEAFLASVAGARPDLILDACQSPPDCDGDGVSDGCELGAGTQIDQDFDGTPDQCLRVDPPVADIAPKMRYVSFKPDDASGVSSSRAYRMTSPDFPDLLKWVGPPNADGISRLQCEPFYQDWTDPWIHVNDKDIVPDAVYFVQGIAADLELSNEAYYSAPPTIVNTSRVWGDVVGLLDGKTWGTGDGVVNFDDVYACIRRFRHLPNAPPTVWVDVAEEITDGAANFADVQQIIYAFQGDAYPYSGPQACPP